MVLLLKTYLFMVAIVVRVHSVSGEPIEGATVRMERDGVASAEAMTDKDGNAQLPNFREGRYGLSVAKEGFELSSQVLLLQDARQEIDVDFIGKTLCNDTDRFPGATWGEHPRPDERSVT